MAPLRSWRYPLLLVALSVAGTTFEQFPRNLTWATGAVWCLAPVAGLLAGVAVSRRAQWRRADPLT